MKIKFLFLLTLIALNGFSQDYKKTDSLRTRFISFSPMTPKLGKVNGFVIGVGHYDGPRLKMQKINGFNLEASPMSLALVTFGINIPFEGLIVGLNNSTLQNTSITDSDDPTILIINGLNISSGGFMSGAEVNGVNISVLTHINKMNGLSINGSVIGTTKFNGVCISGIANISNYGNGMQIAISNVSKNHNGIQIGLFNYSNNLRGLQFGLWNTNGKRKLPFMNWQFKT
jgi:hypothetical protein